MSAGGLEPIFKRLIYVLSVLSFPIFLYLTLLQLSSRLSDRTRGIRRGPPVLCYFTKDKKKGEQPVIIFPKVLGGLAVLACDVTWFGSLSYRAMHWWMLSVPGRSDRLHCPWGNRRSIRNQGCCLFGASCPAPTNPDALRGRYACKGDFPGEGRWEGRGECGSL